MPITGEIEELEIGIVPVEVGQGSERGKLFPVLIVSALIKARHRTAQIDQIELTVASQIHKLLPSAIQISQRRFICKQLKWTEFSSALVWLVEPGICLFRENARKTFAIEVYPSITHAVQTDWQIFEAFCVYFRYLFLNGRLAVLELERRK